MHALSGMRIGKEQKNNENAGACTCSMCSTLTCGVVQRPLHHLGKDMLDLLRPGGPCYEQHASEMEVLENRGRSGGVPLGFFGSAMASPAETLLSLVLAGATPHISADLH